MTHNKLQLNSEKTEVILIRTDKNCPPFLPMPFSLTVAFSSTAHCPWRISSVKPPKSCYYQPVLSGSMKLVTSLSLSCLDYCDSLLYGLPAYSVHSLHHISFMAGLLTLSIAFITYRTVLLSLHSKNVELTTPLIVYFNYSTDTQSNKEFSTA